MTNDFIRVTVHCIEKSKLARIDSILYSVGVCEYTFPKNFHFLKFQDIN